MKYLSTFPYMTSFEFWHMVIPEVGYYLLSWSTYTYLCVPHTIYVPTYWANVQYKKKLPFNKLLQKNKLYLPYYFIWNIVVSSINDSEKYWHEDR